MMEFSFYVVVGYSSRLLADYLFDDFPAWQRWPLKFCVFLIGVWVASPGA